MRRLASLLVALVVVLAGCKVDTTVTVDVHNDGSGVVTVKAALDPEAVRAAETGGGKLEDRVRLSDLTAAGWTVSPWERAGGGDAQIVISKPFESVDQIPSIMKEISGPNGPLRDVAATRDRGLTSTQYEVRGAVDLAAIGTGVAADPDLVKALTNQQVDVNAIDQQLLTELRDSVSVTVEVKLPDGSTKVVHGVPGKRVTFDASASSLNSKRLLLFGLAIVLLLAAGGVLLIGRRRRRARAPIPRFEVHSKRGESMR